MRRCGFIILVFIFMVSLSACGKKQQTQEEIPEPMPMEELSKLSTEAAPMSQKEVAGDQAATGAPLEPLPPVTSYKPTSQEIQIALKNAGYYTGEIDGKIGPLSKKAIGEFQKANNLKIDGVVGPKTWEVLSKYLNPVVDTTTAAKKKKR